MIGVLKRQYAKYRYGIMTDRMDAHLDPIRPPSPKDIGPIQPTNQDPATIIVIEKCVTPQGNKGMVQLKPLTKSEIVAQAHGDFALCKIFEHINQEHGK